MKLAIFAALALAASQCGAPVMTPRLDAGVAADAGTCVAAVDIAATPCERACAHLCALGCSAALPSRGGVACSETCERAAVAGLDLRPTCVELVAVCEGARACGFGAMP